MAERDIVEQLQPFIEEARRNVLARQDSVRHAEYAAAHPDEVKAMMRKLGIRAAPPDPERELRILARAVARLATLENTAAEITRLRADRKALTDACREVSRIEGDVGATDRPDYRAAVDCAGAVARCALAHCAKESTSG